MKEAIGGIAVYRDDFYPITIVHLPDDQDSLRLAGFFIRQSDGNEMTSYIPADIDINAEDWKSE
ncbi:hypothetical protein [Tatumella punctata]|uniref:Uncharacterized protein n=1 Tax=Tatumella punctata TaxID=399969 RepID=A0ABW1VNQ8_9GAMM